MVENPNTKLVNNNNKSNNHNNNYNSNNNNLKDSNPLNKDLFPPFLNSLELYNLEYRPLTLLISDPPKELNPRHYNNPPRKEKITMLLTTF